MATQDIIKKQRFLRGGNADANYGPFANVDLANAFIPNTVDGEGVPNRQDKTVKIAGKEYWWVAPYGDANLVLKSAAPDDIVRLDKTSVFAGSEITPFLYAFLLDIQLQGLNFTESDKIHVYFANRAKINGGTPQSSFGVGKNGVLIANFVQNNNVEPAADANGHIYQNLLLVPVAGSGVSGAALVDWSAITTGTGYTFTTSAQQLNSLFAPRKYANRLRSSDPVVPWLKNQGAFYTAAELRAISAISSIKVSGGDPTATYMITAFLGNTGDGNAWRFRVSRVDAGPTYTAMFNDTLAPSNPAGKSTRKFVSAVDGSEWTIVIDYSILPYIGNTYLNGQPTNVILSDNIFGAAVYSKQQTLKAYLLKEPGLAYSAGEALGISVLRDLKVYNANRLINYRITALYGFLGSGNSNNWRITIRDAANGTIYVNDTTAPANTSGLNTRSVTLPDGSRWVFLLDYSVAPLSGGFYINNNASQVILGDQIHITENANASAFAALKTTKMAIFGDSITYFLDGWAYQAQGAFGNTMYNLALSGSHWRKRGADTDDPVASSATAFISNQFLKLKAGITAGTYQVPDIIIINAGTNDCPEMDSDPDNYDTIMAYASYTLLSDAEKSTLYGALRFNIEGAMTDYPLATIYIATPLQSGGTAGRSASRMQKVVDRIKKMATRYNCIILDQFNESGIVSIFEKSDGTTGKFLGDGVHPNTAGKRIQANYMINRIADRYYSKSA